MLTDNATLVCSRWCHPVVHLVMRECFSWPDIGPLELGSCPCHLPNKFSYATFIVAQTATSSNMAS